eukprot:779874-Pelagomonas_calceolata.AAC.3
MPPGGRLVLHEREQAQQMPSEARLELQAMHGAYPKWSTQTLAKHLGTKITLESTATAHVGHQPTRHRFTTDLIKAS